MKKRGTYHRAKQGFDSGQRVFVTSQGFGKSGWYPARMLYPSFSDTEAMIQFEGAAKAIIVKRVDVRSEEVHAATLLTQ